jgi:hypothetical protein
LFAKYFEFGSDHLLGQTCHCSREDHNLNITVNPHQSGLIGKERSSRSVKQKIALKEKKPLRTQISGKCNEITAANENK